ncbi:MAG: glycosyltransferase family 4 protein [Roseibacillus sp.]|nr:glycosyltransferase family 4 protein [Roseibacillus sp.]
MPDLILGNSNKRFSGVTSTLLQVLSREQNLASVVVFGRTNPDITIPVWGWRRTLAYLKKNRNNPPVFHARRNDEMIQALILRFLSRAKMKIVFTSTAQRSHTRFSRWLMSRMDRVITTCEAAATYLREHREPDHIIPHGIDTSRYSPSETSGEEQLRALGIAGKRAVGIFGRVRPSKGVDILVEAMIPVLQEFEDVVLVVVGECLPKDESYQRKLQETLRTSGLEDRSLFLGKQPFERLPDLFRAMSVVAALSRSEGFGLTVLEAMASGVPVVTSEAGAWKEVVRQEVDGLVCPTGDSEQVRAALFQLLQDPGLAREMGASGRARILSHYTIEREAEELTSYLLSLRDGRAPSRCR